jgi:hypothetical protein
LPAAEKPGKESVKQNNTHMKNTLALFAACILCSVAILKLSGCGGSGPSCGGDKIVSFNDSPHNLTKENIKLFVEGSDVIRPCVTGPTYILKAPGWKLEGTLSGAKWISSGDIEITSANNNSAVHIIGTKDNGTGALYLVTTATGLCPGGDTLTQKGMIVSFAETIGIAGEVCLDPLKQTGSGTLQLIDKASPKGTPAYIDKCVWSVFSGSAELEPQPDETICLVKNATGDFTIRCEVTEDTCTSQKPLSFDIKVSPVCQTKP